MYRRSRPGQEDRRPTFRQGRAQSTLSWRCRNQLHKSSSRFLSQGTWCKRGTPIRPDSASLQGTGSRTELMHLQTRAHRRRSRPELLNRPAFRPPLHKMYRRSRPGQEDRRPTFRQGRAQSTLSWRCRNQLHKSSSRFLSQGTWCKRGTPIRPDSASLQGTGSRTELMHLQTRAHRRRSRPEQMRALRHPSPRQS